MASRKDYVSAAQSIRKIKNPKDRARMTVLFGKRFAEDNPKFDWIRWKTACGYLRTEDHTRKGKGYRKGGWFSGFLPDWW